MENGYNLINKTKLTLKNTNNLKNADKMIIEFVRLGNVGITRLFSWKSMDV